MNGPIQFKALLTYSKHDLLAKLAERLQSQQVRWRNEQTFEKTANFYRSVKNCEL